MSFTRANPGGWSTGATLTSGQINQIDVDHANALDKTTAGDQLAGVVTMASTAAIRVNTSGAAIVSSVSGGIQATASGAMISSANGGIQATASGAIVVSASGGLQAATTGAVQGSAVGAIQSGVPGGFQLTGGSTDWPVFNARSISRGRALRPLWGLPSAWNGTNSWFLRGGGTTGYIYCQLEGLIDNTILNSVQFQFTVNNTHGGGAPSTPPLFTVFRVAVNNGSNSNLEATLNSGDSGSGLGPSPASGAAWFNSQLSQSFTYFCNQANNPINLESFTYYIGIQDENGTNSAAGNAYYSSIATMSVGELTYD